MIQYKDKFPNTPALQVVNLENFPGLVYSPLVLPIDGQNGIGICLHCSVNHAGMLAWTTKYKKRGQFSVPFSYGVARCNIKGAKIPNLTKDGSTIQATLDQISQFGLLPKGTYGPFNLAYNATGYCQDWGKNGVPDVVLKAKTTKFNVYQIKTPEEWVTACNNNHAIFFYSNFTWFNTDQSGIIDPDVLPTTLPKDSPYQHLMGSHAQASIGYKMIGKELFFAVRNFMSIPLCRGGNDLSFKHRGTGLISSRHPVMINALTKYGAYCLEAL